MRRAKSLRNGVHHADGVVWGPVYRTRLILLPSSLRLRELDPRANRRRVGRGRRVRVAVRPQRRADDVHERLCDAQRRGAVASLHARRRRASQRGVVLRVVRPEHAGEVARASLDDGRVFA
eukprot:30813-Pelagococcus_subviridis.AAC.4